MSATDPVATEPQTGPPHFDDSTSREDNTSKDPANRSSLSLTMDVVSVDDVCNWLHSISLSQYAAIFSANSIDGHLLRTLTPQDLRDELAVSNFAHRRILVDAISKLPPPPTPPARDVDDRAAPDPDAPTPAIPLLPNRIPEHGRILDHLSNVRTYHSWLRVAVQFLSFAVVTLRLAPDFRDTRLVSATAFYFAAVAILSLLYGIFRYRQVLRVIDVSTVTNPSYRPDVLGVTTVVMLIVLAAVISIVIIAKPSADD